MSVTQETTETLAGPTISTSSLVNENEHTPANSPSSFKALKKPELVAAAAYFGTETDGNVKDILADLEDSGVTWADYAEAFKIPGWENLKGDPEANLPEPVEDWDEKEEEEEKVTDLTVVPVVPVLDQEKKYLVKFVGKNPYFEHKRFKFTQDRPYAVMTADQAQDVLESEPTNFRQAFPKELQEFYS
jgi:hypothetical protein